MRRLIGIGAGLLVALIVQVPAALAADPSMAHSGRVLIQTDGDVTVPAGEQADAVIVVNGTATIEGEVNFVMVVDGDLVMNGATAETVVSIRGPVMLGPGTTVKNDLFKLDSLVTKSGNGDVQGQIRDIGTEVAGFGLFLGPLFILLFIGFALAAVLAGLLVAALGARQVRAAEELITRRPVETFAVGIVGIFTPILLIAGLFVTVVGIPLALAILLVAWPLVGFLGYIVAGIWIGDWVLNRMYPNTIRERPYLASIVGLVILGVLGAIPIVGAVASLFGYGAVISLAWQTFRGHQAAAAPAPTGTHAPMAV
jgi:MFS family permease